MYKKPKACPRCGSETGLQEQINPFTTGLPLRGGGRLRLLSFRGLIRPRFRVEYRCEKCGFLGKYHDRHGTWMPVKSRNSKEK